MKWLNNSWKSHGTRWRTRVRGGVRETWKVWIPANKGRGWKTKDWRFRYWALHRHGKDRGGGRNNRQGGGGQKNEGGGQQSGEVKSKGEGRVGGGRSHGRGSDK